MYVQEGVGVAPGPAVSWQGVSSAGLSVLKDTLHTHHNGADIPQVQVKIAMSRQCIGRMEGDGRGRYCDLSFRHGASKQQFIHIYRNGQLFIGICSTARCTYCTYRYT